MTVAAQAAPMNVARIADSVATAGTASAPKRSASTWKLSPIQETPTPKNPSPNAQPIANATAGDLPWTSNSNADRLKLADHHCE